MLGSTIKLFGGARVFSPLCLQITCNTCWLAFRELNYISISYIPNFVDGNEYMGNRYVVTRNEENKENDLGPAPLEEMAPGMTSH